MDRICTIIAMNYLPQAMALLKSTRVIYPEIEFYVLIIDSDSRDSEYLQSAKILIPADLNIPSDWLSQMRMYYDEMELATSLKPFLLETLLHEDVDSVTYLDPDILLFGELTEGMVAAKNCGIALTPHRLTPSKIAEADFAELGFLKYGIFNLGYIAVGQKSRPMLTWWAERLRWFCTKFQNDPVFTDQKWINFIPALFEFKKIDNPGYNFASWNINERPLSIRNGKIFAGEMQLVFIHFSQMSGALAKGQHIGHWEKLLTKNEDFISTSNLISQITNDYSKTLVDFQSRINRVGGGTRQNNKINYHFKRNLINRAILNPKEIDASKSTYSKSLHRIQTINKGLLLLEKSAAFNGLSDGLLLDYMKIRFKIKRIILSFSSRFEKRGS
jgi:hypothetical protein